jgi:hypothetical protein
MAFRDRTHVILLASGYPPNRNQKNDSMATAKSA